MDSLNLRNITEYYRFFRFLRESFRGNLRSIVAWAVWYLYDKGSSEFETSDVLAVAPSLTEDRVERALKSLNVEFKDGRCRLTEESISIVKMYLIGRISNWWPVFSTFHVRKERGGEDIKFFKIARGVSSRYYVDFPNDLISEYVSNIFYLDSICSDMNEFYENAKKFTKEYNDFIREGTRALFGVDIDWLSFTILNDLKYYREKKYRIKTNVSWLKFLKFIESYSKNDEIGLWRKYRYITNCKRVLYTTLTESESKIKESSLPKAQNDVRKIAQDDLDAIYRTLNDLIAFLDAIGRRILNRIVKIRKIVVGKRRHFFIIPYAHLYIPELITMFEALKDLVDRGAFPSCYREMRKIVENLAWVMFDDLLYFRSLTGERVWPYRPYSNIPTEWHYLKSKFADLSEIGKAWDKIRNGLLRGIRSLRHDSAIKDEITDTILRNLTYPLFIALFSKVVKNVDDKIRFLQVFGEISEDYAVLSSSDYEKVLNVAKDNLKGILENLNLSVDAVNEILNKLEGLKSTQEVIIPLPSNRFVLQFIDYIFSTNLNRFYDDYSFFVHSYFTSWHVIPFSSVLEIKIFRHELSKFSNEIQMLFDSYVKTLGQIAKSLAKSKG